MADCFIKLFDDIALTSSETPATENTFCLMARKCMALTLRNELEARIHAIRLSDIRNDLIVNNPALFEEGLS